MHRHKLDPVSLVFGLMFAVFGLVWLVGDVDVDALNWQWVWPLPLLALGLLFVLSSWPRSERIDDEENERAGGDT